MLASIAITRRPRGTGRPAVTTSRRSTPSSTPALTSRRKASSWARQPTRRCRRVREPGRGPSPRGARGPDLAQRRRSTLPDGPGRSCLRGSSTARPGGGDRALWSACHGGQQEAAAYLLDRGADLNWVGWNDLTPLDAALTSATPDLVARLRPPGCRRSGQPPRPPRDAGGAGARPRWLPDLPPIRHRPRLAVPSRSDLPSIGHRPRLAVRSRSDLPSIRRRPRLATRARSGHDGRDAEPANDKPRRETTELPHFNLR